MPGVINLSINNTTDQTQRKSKRVKTWTCIVKASKQSQLHSCGGDGTLQETAKPTTLHNGTSGETVQLRF